jgi:hypothetical protein
MPEDAPAAETSAPSDRRADAGGARRLLGPIAGGVLAGLVANQIGDLAAAHALAADAVSRVLWWTSLPIAWAAWGIRQHLRLQQGRTKPSSIRRPLFRGWLILQVAGALTAMDLGGRWGMWAFIFNLVASGGATLVVLGALAAPTAAPGKVGETVTGFLSHPPGAPTEGIDPAVTSVIAVVVCSAIALAASALAVGIGEATPWSDSAPTREQQSPDVSDVESVAQDGSDRETPAPDGPISPTGPTPSSPPASSSVPQAEPADPVETHADLTG